MLKWNTFQRFCKYLPIRKYVDLWNKPPWLLHNTWSSPKLTIVYTANYSSRQSMASNCHFILCTVFTVLHTCTCTCTEAVPCLFACKREAIKEYTYMTSHARNMTSHALNMTSHALHHDLPLPRSILPRWAWIQISFPCLALPLLYPLPSPHLLHYPWTDGSLCLFHHYHSHWY